MIQRLFLLLNIFVVVSCLACSEDQNYLKLIKVNGESYSEDESYQILSGSLVLFTSSVLVNNNVKTDEVCLPKTANNTYTVVLKDSYGDGWRWESYITLMGSDDNILFKGSLANGNEVRFPIAFIKPVEALSYWKMKAEAVPSDWKSNLYDDVAWTTIQLGFPAGTAIGTQYFRQSFSGVIGMAAYESQLTFQYGIIVYINGNEIYRNNMPSGSVAYTTPCTGGYSSLTMKRLIRTGREIGDPSCVIAAELHYPNMTSANPINFFATLLAYTNTTGESPCYGVSYPVVVTTVNINYPTYVYDFDLGSYGQQTAIASNPVTVKFSFGEDIIPVVNGFRTYAHSNPDKAPRNFVVSGSSNDATYTTLYTAMDVSYGTKEFRTTYSHFNSGLYRYYKVYITDSNHNNLFIYELQPLVCNLPIVSSIVYSSSPYTFIASYEEVLIKPDVENIHNCTVYPPLPTGINMDSNTCVISGKSNVTLSSTLYEVTSSSPPLSGTFLLAITICTGSSIEILRTYKANAFTETITLKEIATGTIVYANTPNSDQKNSVDWSKVFCLQGTGYSITVASTSSYWTQNSYVYVSGMMNDEDKETILRGRYDSNLDLAVEYTFNAHYAIPSKSYWHYRMSVVPQTWYDDSFTGWNEASYGAYPASTNRIQLYKRQFIVSTLNNTAGFVIQLRYIYSCVIYLNSVEVFRNGVEGAVSTTSVSTNSYGDVLYYSISLPVASVATSSSPSIPYLREGSNVIAVAIVAIADSQTAVYFDAAVRLLSTGTTSSRVFDYAVTGNSISGSYTSAFDDYYSTKIYYNTCRDNWLRIIFNNNRREWINSIMIKSWYAAFEPSITQFSIEARNTPSESWTTIREVSGIEWSLQGQEKKISLSNSIPYNQYRFVNMITGNSSSCAWKISRIDLLCESTVVELVPLVYESPIVVYRYIEMAEVYPNTNLYSDFSVEPALPTGLSIDSTTGTLSGTAVTQQSPTNYIVTAHYISGDTVTATISITVEICTGNKALITFVARSDNYPNDAAFYLFRGRTTSGTALRAKEGFSIANNLNYVDMCLEDDLYSILVKSSSSNGWAHPSGYRLTVDVGAFVMDLGQVPAVTAGASSVTSAFSSILPFQADYAIWKVYKDKLTSEPWTSPSFDDSAWSSFTSPMIGTNARITTYIRKAFPIPSLGDYHVLNVRMKYVGGVAVYFNGNTVARFNLAQNYTDETGGIMIHDATVLSRFHILLAVSGAIEGGNVIAFEVHRPSSQSSAEPVVFEATGIYGVSSCSLVQDSFSVLQGTDVVDGLLPSLFDLNPSTYAAQPNDIGSEITWTVDNLEGTSFNYFGMLTPFVRTSWSWSMYGHYHGINDYIPMLEIVDASTKALETTMWKVDVGRAMFGSFIWQSDNIASDVVAISDILFYYCMSSGAICPAVGSYPSVAEGELSPAMCSEGFIGYSYRICHDGALGEVYTDKCRYILPRDLFYKVAFYDLVVGIPMTGSTPEYTNIVTHFDLSNQVLPKGLFLHNTTGVLYGTPEEPLDQTIFTVYAYNPQGATQTEITLSVRMGRCKTEGFFPTCDVGETVTYSCSVQGAYIGSVSRTCNLGKTDGVWSASSGFCISVLSVSIISAVVIIVVTLTICILVRISRKVKAVGGTKGKKVKMPKKAKVKNVVV